MTILCLVFHEETSKQVGNKEACQRRREEVRDREVAVSVKIPYKDEEG